MKPETIEERIANHLRPPERPEFFDEFWERAERVAARSERRWRMVAIAATAIAVAAVSTATIYAFRGSPAVGVNDRTLQCKAPFKVAEVDANATMKQGTIAQEPARPAGVSVGLFKTSWIKFDAAHPDVSFDTSACRPAHALPLTRTGLATGEVYRAGSFLAFVRRCHIGPSALVRLRWSEDSTGAPTRAVLAIRSAKGVPMILVSWSPDKVGTYYSAKHCY